ncbi:hypothetical protein CFOLD11_12240 [Clostridium folliculivorans]|uniref:DUF3784 domain-containing protein n=1 Tax=Clostridium folliculivorans TaxID=2886038 RepID=A0A9W5Y0K5_9CLOT|nr:DUF3784 domain-containing protein [Clostridium folliculivorans]GKU24398.1 hypothetical protein CFOLD11_12240 [Clostridium folliculivorans]
MGLIEERRDIREYGWAIGGLVMAGLFGLLGMIFLIFKEKACVLISGYNLKSKKEREEYDEVSLCKDERNFFFICAIIFLIGAVISIFFGPLSFWISFVAWLIYFFKNVHFDTEKAFAKYKRKK